MEVEQTQINADTDGPSFVERIKEQPRPILTAVLAFLFLLFCLFLFATIIYWQNQSRPLKPERMTATPNQIIVDGQPMLVTFEELNNNATEFQNKWVQVAGSYFPKSPTTCNPRPSNGPIFESVLVSDGLQLNIQGGEEALAIIAINTDMVVQGIWRLYTGPVGCGKEPASDVIWYLDIRAVVQPNPIAGSTPLPIQGTIPADILPPESGNTPTPSVDGSIPTPTNTPIPVTVVVETPIITNTPTPEGLVATPTTMIIPTETAINGTFTRTPTPDPNATATPPVTSTATATPTVTGTPPTAVATNTPVSSIPTATKPPGYPGVTPAATSTPGGYP